MTRSATAAMIAQLSTAPALPVMAQFALRVAVVLTTWDMRRKTRKGLKDLSDHHLRDIGLTRHEAEMERHRLF